MGIFCLTLDSRYLLRAFGPLVVIVKDSGLLLVGRLVLLVMRVIVVVVSFGKQGLICCVATWWLPLIF